MIAAESDDLSEESQNVKREQRSFMKEMFEKHFPDIIEIILIYIQKAKFKSFVNEINSMMLHLVLTIMKDKNDFDNILNKLRNEFRGKKPVASQAATADQANTRVIVVEWYIALFKNFDTDLIDHNGDIYVKVVENIDFNHRKLFQLEIDLICMLSVKNEEYFR